MPREIISVAVSPELAERLRRAAAEQDRSASAVARRAIQQALDDHDLSRAAA